MDVGMSQRTDRCTATNHMTESKLVLINDVAKHQELLTSTRENTE